MKRMKRRLFIAIPVPEEIKIELREVLARPQKSSKQVRWMPEENWHLTLVFLGYEEEDVVPNIRAAMDEVIETARGLSVQFERICYGPLGHTPRMVWLTTTQSTSRAIDKLKAALEEKLLAQNVPWDRETRPFQGHITLARFEPRAKSALPDIETPFSARYAAPSVDLMESHLARSGATYSVLYQVAL